MTSQNLLSEACIALGEHLASLINSPKNSKASTTSTTSVSKLASHREHSSTTTIVSTVSSSKDTRVTLRRDALNAFADACGHAALAESYELVIHAARHYWNLCMPYLQQIDERNTLYENLYEILQSLQITYKFKPKEVSKLNDEQEHVEEKKSDDKKDTSRSS